MKRRTKTVASFVPVASVLAVVLFATPLLAATKVVGHSEYRALVRECRTFLGQREIDPNAAKKLAVQLRGIGSVILPSGETIPVDTKSEADALDAISGTTPDKKLQQRFAALDEQLATVSKPAKNDPRLTVERILRASEFKASQPEKMKEDDWDWSFFPKWMKPVENALKPSLKWLGKQFTAFGKWFVKGIENIFRAIGKFFRWIFNKFPQSKWKWNPKNPFASLGNGVLLTLYFLATVAAVVGIYFLSRYLFDLYEIRTGRKRRASGALGGDLDLSAEGITDPLNTARERADKGDYRSAIRLTYIAALWKLGEGGILTLEKNRTNWEYQRALRKQSQVLHDDLLPGTRLFDRIWYGKQPGTEREFAMISAIYDNLPSELVVSSQGTGDSTGNPTNEPANSSLTTDHSPLTTSEKGERK